MRYLTVDELIYINEQLPSEEAIHTIVDGKRKVRDIGLLEAAAARPMSSVFGEDAYPTVEEKAAALLHSITRNHPFADGNKRTATIALILMLAVNGRRVIWQQAEALQQIVDTAEGKLDASALAAWLPTEACEAQPQPDAARDMATIAQIMDEQRWLLEQLAER
ncbi:MAG: type II toxin-antitoxin system death-on-curing family toxin [Anaerolineae bacterium]|nr:type II toxin-antitoxin system death-on-curing family toxin [Anaerolineae bacterium]